MAFRDELARKAIHLTSSLIPLLYWWPLSREVCLAILAGLLVVAIVVERLRGRQGAVRDFIERWFGSMMRTGEQKTWTGATFVVLAGLLSIAIFPKPVAIAALLTLSISDSLASLIGSQFGKVRFLGKSLAGSGAFFVSALVIGLVVFRGYWPVALIGAAVGTVVEALSVRLGEIKLDDNFTVPLSTGGATWLACLWLAPPLLALGP